MAATGFRHYPGLLGPDAQRRLARSVLDAARTAPFYRPLTPAGRLMSVQMTNMGPLGWISDARGYRYAGAHPATARPWPPIPTMLFELWASLADGEVPPDVCLVNLYRGEARMGLHQDRDEADFAFPVLSISLGDTATFRIGGRERGDPTSSLRLASGDVCLLGGDARLAFHGVDRIVRGSSRVIPGAAA